MQLNDTWPTKHPCSHNNEMAKRRDQIGKFYEFFAVGGMARAGLGNGWTCLFSNDIDDKKADAYRENWGSNELLVRDIGKVCTCELPGKADLAWASFPCQDLSLAGTGAGLSGLRSGTFWPFWELMQKLRGEARSPSIIVLENVCGALTSHGGGDFQSLIKALRIGGYRSGALVVDAALFVPQSRPRLFIVGISNDLEIDASLICTQPSGAFHTSAVSTAYRNLAPADKAAWIWWNVPGPSPRQSTFSDVLEDDVPWHSPEVTRGLLALMSPLNRAKVTKAKKFGRKMVGGVYKRTRADENGIKAQRAEIRFDDIAGCLRTPGGGSSRQSILVVEGNKIASRLLSPREAARLMGLPEDYKLPRNYNDAYHLMGDGVVVPVVRHIARYLLEPLLETTRSSAEHAA